MNNEFVISKVLDRIDHLDNKMDGKMSNLGEEITQCKLDIQGVQKDLTNHLDTKKNEVENSKRKVYYVIAILTVSIAVYEASIRLFQL